VSAETVGSLSRGGDDKQASPQNLEAPKGGVRLSHSCDCLPGGSSPCPSGKGISFARGAHQDQAVYAVADERGLHELSGRRVDLERRQGGVFMGCRTYTFDRWYAITPWQWWVRA
jgi:hypothetical protein